MKVRHHHLHKVNSMLVKLVEVLARVDIVKQVEIRLMLHDRPPHCGHQPNEGEINHTTQAADIPESCLQKMTKNNL